MHYLFRALIAAAFAVGAIAAEASPRVLLRANFNDKPIDQPLMARGPAFNEPVRNDTGFVRREPFDSPHLEIADTSSCCSQSTVFEFPNGEEITNGTLDIRADVYFPAPVSAEMAGLREQGSAAVSFLNFYTGTLTTSTGNGWLNAQAGQTYSGSLLNPGYPIGRWVPMRVQYALDQRRVRIELDGKLIWEKTDFSLTTTRGIGRLYMGSNNTGPATGSVMRVDNLVVTHCNSAVFGDCLMADGFQN